MRCYDYEIYDCYCSTCEENSERLSEIKYWFTAALEQFYTNKSIDNLDLENCLDEICHKLGIKLPNGDLDIQRVERMPYTNKSDVKRFDIQEWKSWNNQYLKAINT